MEQERATKQEYYWRCGAKGCQTWFSIGAESPLAGFPKIALTQILEVLFLICADCGVRQICDLTGVTRPTVLKILAMSHAVMEAINLSRRRTVKDG